MLNFNSEHFLEHEPDHTTERQLLLGIDAPMTGTTVYLLRTVGAFFMPYSEYVHIQLVTVIPVPVFGGGRSGPPRSFPPSARQLSISLLICGARFPSPILTAGSGSICSAPGRTSI